MKLPEDGAALVREKPEPMKIGRVARPEVTMIIGNVTMAKGANRSNM